MRLMRVKNSLAEYTPFRFSPGMPWEARQPRAGADEHRVEPLVREQLVQRDAPADDHVRLDLHAHGLERADLAAHEALGQAELRNAVHEHAARRVQRLEHGHVVAELFQIARAGQPGRAAADDRDALAVVRRGLRALCAVRHGVVRHEPLQPADAHRLALDAAHAARLALRLLPIRISIRWPQAVGGRDHVVRLEEFAH